MLGIHSGERDVSWRQLRLAIAIVVFLLAVTVTAGAAQQASSISGLVSDYTGAGVAGVTVEIVGAPGTARTSATDGAGRYRFAGLSAGEYALRVTAPGYLPIERGVTVGASASVVADVELEVLVIDGIDVSAAQVRAEIDAQRALTPGGVTVVEAEELVRRPVNGLADMLRYVPGVWAESSAGSDELFFSSRGSNLDAVDYDRNGVKMLQDGLPVTAADGNNHNRVVDPLSVRYAVVARGANALTYGASTLGGAIDVISPTARNTPPLSVTINSGAYGPFNGRATVGAAGEALDGLVTVEGRRWDGYRDHSRLERWGVYANAGWLASERVDVRVFGTYLDYSVLLPDALTRAEVAADPNQASSVALGGNYGKDLITGRVATRLTWTPGPNQSLMAGLSYEEQALYHPIVDRIMVDFDGPGPNPPVEVFSLLVDTDHRDLGGVVRYNQVVGAHDLLMGVNYGSGTVEGGNYRNLGGQPNGVAQYVDNRARGLEAYLMDRWRLSDRWTFVFGAQYVGAARDVRTTDAGSGTLSNPKRDYNAFNPRAGIIASLSSTLEAYGNVSRLFEAPTTYQMEDNVLGSGATLDPMSGNVAEIGLRSTGTPSGDTQWSWDVAAFYAQVSDEILSIDDPGAPGNSLTTNVDKTVHAGIEAFSSVSVAVGDRHRIDPLVSLTLNHFRFVVDDVYGDNALPAAPKVAARAEMMYRRAGGAYAGPTLDYVGDRFADFNNTYTVDGHVLMGLRAGWSTERWELFGEVRNLFDAGYTATVRVFDVAATGARALYPGSPRSVYVGARFAY
ncbi:MAG: TonB-dependent receptor [Gemmatimonadetes bacterium]|nr:TonB-dependent receptor [Gemmatimonadota bacterium]